MNSIFRSQNNLSAWAQRKIREYRVITYLEELSEQRSEIEKNMRSQPLHTSFWSVLKEGAE